MTAGPLPTLPSCAHCPPLERHQTQLWYVELMSAECEAAHELLFVNKHLLAHHRNRARRALQGTAGRSTRSPLDDKTLPWAVFAQQCVGSSRCDGAVTQADVTALAQSLTDQPPYVISCNAIHVEVRADKTSLHCHYDEKRYIFLLMLKTTISLVLMAC